MGENLDKSPSTDSSLTELKQAFCESFSPEFDVYAAFNDLKQKLLSVSITEKQVQKEQSSKKIDSKSSTFRKLIRFSKIQRTLKSIKTANKKEKLSRLKQLLRDLKKESAIKKLARRIKNGGLIDLDSLVRRYHRTNSLEECLLRLSQLILRNPIQIIAELILDTENFGEKTEGLSYFVYLLQIQDSDFDFSDFEIKQKIRRKIEQTFELLKSIQNGVLTQDEGITFGLALKICGFLPASHFWLHKTELSLGNLAFEENGLNLQDATVDKRYGLVECAVDCDSFIRKESLRLKQSPKPIDWNKVGRFLMLKRF